MKILLMNELFRILPLCWQALWSKVREVKDTIFYSEANDMFKNIVKALEALIRGLIYFFILLIGLTVTALGTFIVFFTAFRFAQLLWVIIFKEAWL